MNPTFLIGKEKWDSLYSIPKIPTPPPHLVDTGRGEKGNIPATVVMDPNQSRNNAALAARLHFHRINETAYTTRS